MCKLKHNTKQLIKLTIDEVNELIKANPQTTFFIKDGIRVKYKRAKILLTVGLDCKMCNLKGEYFTINEDNGGGVHLDLFGKNENKQEVLLTVDHIIPKSKGGRDHISNFQCLCMPCNSKKGDKLNGYS